MASTNLSFRTPQPLLEQIQSRDLKGVSNPGAVAKRDVERWYAVLQEALVEVRMRPVEAVVLVHYAGAFQGKVSHGNILGAADVIEHDPLGLGAAFEAPRATLAAQMDEWSRAGLYAAWDAAERYEVLVRRNFEREEQALDLTLGAALHLVGLHTYDLSLEELAVVERVPAVEADRLPGAYARALEGDA